MILRSARPAVVAYQMAVGETDSFPRGFVLGQHVSRQRNGKLNFPYSGVTQRVEQLRNPVKIDISHVTILLGWGLSRFDYGQRLFAIACAIAED